VDAEDTSPSGVALAYGGFWRRLLAALIDSLVFVVVNTAFQVLAGGADAAGLLGLAAGLAYEVGMTASRFQATLGKLALGLRVVDRDGRRLTVGRSLGRWAAKLLSAVLLGIGFLMIAVTRRKRGLHDMIAGTLVLRMAPDTGPAVRLPS
jgi:uncharacterized RDD family membrane protein YckC